jgi:hypothetical protein
MTVKNPYLLAVMAEELKERKMRHERVRRYAGTIMVALDVDDRGAARAPFLDQRLHLPYQAPARAAERAAEVVDNIPVEDDQFGMFGYLMKVFEQAAMRLVARGPSEMDV